MKCYQKFYPIYLKNLIIMGFAHGVMSIAIIVLIFLSIMLCRLDAWQVRDDVLKESCVEITLNGYYTPILATLVLLLGRFWLEKSNF